MDRPGQKRPRNLPTKHIEDSMSEQQQRATATPIFSRGISATFSASIPCPGVSYSAAARMLGACH